MTPEDRLEVVVKKIRQLVEAKAYVNLELKMEAGRIVLVRSNTSVRVEDLDVSSL